METVTSNHPRTIVRERRATPRLRVPPATFATLSGWDERLTVRDISFGGFSVESDDGLTPGTLHHCEFSAGTPGEKILAQVIRSETTAEGFATGFRFAMFEVDSRRRVNELLEGVARTLGFTRVTH